MRADAAAAAAAEDDRVRAAALRALALGIDNDSDDDDEEEDDDDSADAMDVVPSSTTRAAYRPSSSTAHHRGGLDSSVIEMTGRALDGGRSGLVGDGDGDDVAEARDKQWRPNFPGAIHSPTGGGKHAK